MGLEIMRIPPVTTEPEGVFSGAKGTIYDWRSHWWDVITEAFACCISWESEGLIAEVHNDVWDIQQMVDAQYKEAIAKEM